MTTLRVGIATLDEYKERTLLGIIPPASMAAVYDMLAETSGIRHWRKVMVFRSVAVVHTHTGVHYYTRATDMVRKLRVATKQATAQHCVNGVSHDLRDASRFRAAHLKARDWLLHSIDNPESMENPPS